MITHTCHVQDTQFDFRLMWFIDETAKLGKQQLKMRELELENAGLDEDSLEDKRIELEATFEPVYTEKSYDEYELRVIRNLLLKEKELEQCNSA